jgi:hypothetical protein
MLLSGGDGEAGTPVTLQFNYRLNGGSYVSRSDSGVAYTRGELFTLASEGSLVATFTGRLGVNTEIESPQPAIWSRGPIHLQRGRQVFPALSGDDTRFLVSGRHIEDGASIYMDGRRVAGTVRCRDGELPDCEGELVEILLSSRPTPAGDHYLQVQNPGGLHSNDFIIHTDDLVQDNCPDIPNPLQADSDGDGIGDRCDDDAFGFSINPGISGSWYDPSHDGEGWFVQVLDGNRAVVYWFTYGPPGPDGKKRQAWIGGAGKVVGSSIVIESASTEVTGGPSFGQGFDPDDVIRYPWGKLVLSFSGCNEGVMYYQSDDLDFGSGSLDLVRVTQIDSLDCSDPAMPAQEPEDFGVDAAISGAWFDPTHDGEGWFFEVLANNKAVVSWFSYDPEGNQAWFLNAGSVDDKKITVDLLVPGGTVFGPTFDAGEVVYPDWGKATFEFDDCDTGTMKYESIIPGYGSGELNLTRVSQLAGLACQ